MKIKIDAYSHLNHVSNVFICFCKNNQMQPANKSNTRYIVFSFSNAVSFSGVGITMMLLSTLVCIYYNIIIAYSIYYMFASFQFPLPWSDCSSWSEKDCNKTVRGMPSTAWIMDVTVFNKMLLYRFSQKCLNFVSLLI